MAEKKIIEVQVKESGVDELNKKLDTTERNLREVKVEAKKTETAINEVGQNGGAIATLDELTGGLATKFKNAAEAAKLFGKSTRAALITTGIGAIVVALGLVVAYWDEIVDYVDGTNKKLERQNKLLQTQMDIVEGENSLIDAQIELAEAQGKTTDELIEKKRTLLQAEIGISGALLNTLNLQKEQLKLEIARDNARIMAANRGISAGSFGLINNLFDLADQGPLHELNKQIIEITENIYKSQTALQNLMNGQRGEGSIDAKGRDKLQKINPLTGESWQAQLDAEAEFFKKQFGLKKANDQALLQAQLATTKHFVKIDKDGVEARVKFAQLEADQKAELLYSTAQGIMAFADLIGQTTGVGKALASAAAITNTWAGVSEVLATKSTLPEPFATIARIANIATVVATGLNAVKQINSVQVPNANISSSYFGSASTGGSAGAAVQTPSFNIVGDSGQNQLVDTIREQAGRPVRAYIVQDDVRSASELDRRIRASASLG